MIGAVRLIREEFELPLSQHPRDLLRSRVSEVYDSFGGRKGNRAKFEFMLWIESAIIAFVQDSRCYYDKDIYCLRSKLSRRKRKKMRVGEYSNVRYKIHYIGFGSLPPRVTEGGNMAFDPYAMYLVSIKDKSKNEQRRIYVRALKSRKNGE